MATKISDKDAPRERAQWNAFYQTKYRNIWFRRFEIKGVTKQQELYIKRKLWAGKPLACFKAINLGASFLGGLPPKAQEALSGNVSAGFATFATSTYSQYDYPATGLLINERGSPYIPTGAQVVGKDVVLIPSLDAGGKFGTLVKKLIDSIVDCEMAGRKNRKLSVGSAGVEVGIDCPTKAEELARKMMGDEAVSAFEGGDTPQIKPFSGGQPYLVDKIRIEKEAREAELKCLLGLDSVATEKKERLITDEAQAKELECELSKEIFLGPLRDWCAEIAKVLGFHLEIVDPFEKEEEKGEGDETSESEAND